MYVRFFKRAMDVTLSLLSLILLSPVLLVLTILGAVKMKGNPFFTQPRPGKNEKIFKLIKFRSMTCETDAQGNLLPDEVRLTGYGKLLRSTSLDELPQIWDIFIGNMSVVGPRPALWNQDDLVAEREKYGANDVTPGLTGWAQVNGRDELEIPVKAKLDGEYVQKMSFGFDVKCFFGTITSVLKHEGVVEGGTGAMEKKEDAKK